MAFVGALVWLAVSQRGGVVGPELGRLKAGVAEKKAIRNLRWDWGGEGGTAKLDTGLWRPEGRGFRGYEEGWYFSVLLISV